MHATHQVRLEKETQHDKTAGRCPSKNRSSIQMRKIERITKSGELNVEHNKAVLKKTLAEDKKGVINLPLNIGSRNIARESSGTIFDQSTRALLAENKACKVIK